MLIQDLTLKDSNGAAKRLAWSLHSVAIIFFCGAFLVFFQIIAYLCPRKKYSNTLKKRTNYGNYWFDYHWMLGWLLCR